MVVAFGFSAYKAQILHNIELSWLGLRLTVSHITIEPLWGLFNQCALDPRTTVPRTGGKFRVCTGFQVSGLGFRVSGFMDG